ncbi:hypothetical protein ACLX1H_000175 [Fusarium chlamydosporum]
MTSHTTFAVEAFTLLSIGIVIIFLRTYARLRQVGIQNFEADDYLMLLAIIPYTIETALAYTVGAQFKGLTNSGMTDEERKALSPDSDEYGWRVGGSKIQVAGWVMYASVLWVIKAALCAFYFRLTPALSKIYIFVIVCLNIVTDIYLLAIPIPMLWGARIPKVKKYGLLVLFSGAVFVMVAGLLRCFLILQNPETGPEEGASWAVRESFVAVVTSNLPSTWGWMRQKLKPLFGSLLSSNNVSSKYKGGPEPGSIMLGDGRGSGWKSRSGRSLQSRTGLGTANDNAEHNIYIHGGGDASSDEIIPPMPDE